MQGAVSARLTRLYQRFALGQAEERHTRAKVAKNPAAKLRLKIVSGGRSNPGISPARAVSRAASELAALFYVPYFLHKRSMGRLLRSG